LLSLRNKTVAGHGASAVLKSDVESVRTHLWRLLERHFRALNQVIGAFPHPRALVSNFKRLSSLRSVDQGR
jgi:hypothetical protein